jgi:hypothetical protein
LIIAAIALSRCVKVCTDVGQRKPVTRVILSQACVFPLSSSGATHGTEAECCVKIACPACAADEESTGQGFCKGQDCSGYAAD